MIRHTIESQEDRYKSTREYSEGMMKILRDYTKLKGNEFHKREEILNKFREANFKRLIAKIREAHLEIVLPALLATQEKLLDDYKKKLNS